MTKIVILEGPDGSGKTTLAKALQNMGYRYAHEGPTPRDECALLYYATRLLWAIKEDKPIVFDRFHLGAHVYGPILRNRVELTNDEITLFDRLILSKRVRLFLCLPGYEHARCNWQDNKPRKKELFSDPLKFKQSYDAFLKLRTRYNRARYSRITCWNYRMVDARVFAESIDHEWAVFDDLLPDGVVGSTRARYLFVGDRAAGAPDVPFMSEHKSSGFLNWALREANYQEREIAFVNSHTLDDRSNAELIARVISQLKLKRVIALGRNAQDIVHRAMDFAGNNLSSWSKLMIRHVPHPQYYRRFHHHEMNHYVQMLREVR